MDALDGIGEPAMPLENEKPAVQSSGEGSSAAATRHFSENRPKDSELRSDNSSKAELLAATKIQARARGASARRKSVREKNRRSKSKPAIEVPALEEDFSRTSRCSVVVLRHHASQG